MLWFFFKTVSSCLDDDVRDSEVSSHTVIEEKEIVRSWNQEVHSQIIVIYLMNLKSDHFKITSWMWMKTRAVRLQIDLRCSKEKK